MLGMRNASVRFARDRDYKEGGDSCAAVRKGRERNAQGSLKTVLPRKVYVRYNTPALIDFRLSPGGDIWKSNL